MPAAASRPTLARRAPPAQRSLAVEVRRKRFDPPKTLPSDDVGSPIVDARRGLYSSRAYPALAAAPSPPHHGSPAAPRVLYPPQTPQTPTQPGPGGGPAAGGGPGPAVIQANSFF